MIRFYFFLVVLVVQLSFSVNAMSLHNEEYRETLPISSQPKATQSIHPGLEAFRAGAEELKKFKVIVKEDGSSEPCQPVQLFKALGGKNSDEGPLKFFRQSNELEFKPSRSILRMLLAHASGIYMEEATTKANPVGFFLTCISPCLWAPPVPVIPHHVSAFSSYGDNICGAHTALKNHYRLLMERRDILDQELSDDISDVIKDKRLQEKIKVQSELQKTANFIGRTSCGGLFCSYFICVGLPLSCCEDTGSSVCGKCCGPKDHLLSKSSFAEQEKLSHPPSSQDNPLEELLLEERS